MPKALTNAKIEELSLVFKTDPQTGVEMTPMNQNARVLAVKGSESKPFIGKLTEALKAYFAPNYTPGEYPVTEAADDIDHDGDGPEDYNQIFSAIACVYNDISSCYWISDDAARSVAIKTAIDGFLTELDAFRSGKSDKAGARHSKADNERIAAIGDHLDAAKKAHDKVGDHLDAAKASHAELLPQADKEDQSDDKGDGEGEDDAAKAKAKDDEGKYGDVEYADTKNKKYPIDTEEHAKAAWSYINQEKNASEYDADELAAIKGKIKAACKKFGIEIAEDKAGPVDSTIKVEVGTDAVKAVVGEISTMLETFKADITKQLADQATCFDDKITEKVDAVLAPVTEELATKTQEVSKLSATVAALNTANARKASSPGGLPHYDGEEMRDNSFTTQESKPGAIDPNTPAGEAIRALLHAK